MDNRILCLESDHNCPICLDVIDDDVITLQKCKHQFHMSCITMWFEKNNTCPLCRENILDLYRIKYLKRTFWGSTYVNMVVELKENKIMFYQIDKIKAKDRNLTAQNYHFDNLRNPSTLDELTVENNNTIDLANKNFILNLKSNEKIGNFGFQILYSDIFKVSNKNNKISFHNLKVKSGEKNAIRIKNKKKNNKIKIKFANPNQSTNFFTILKKRHQYFTETNY